MGKKLACWCGLWLLVGLMACSGQKKPAESAFAQVQASVTAVSTDLEKYAPDEYALLMETVNAMKAKLNARDYDAVLALRSEAMTRLAAASGVTAKRKLESSKQVADSWSSLGAAVPDMIGKISSRIDDLRAMSAMPNGISVDAVNQAEAALPGLNATWAAVVALSKKGDTESAISKAKELKQRCAQIGGTLGLRLW